MASYLFRRVNRKLEIVLLVVVLLEVLLLGWSIIGIRRDFDKNFNIIAEKLGNHNDDLSEKFNGSSGD